MAFSWTVEGGLTSRCGAATTPGPRSPVSAAGQGSSPWVKASYSCAHTVYRWPLWRALPMQEVGQNPSPLRTLIRIPVLWQQCAIITVTCTPGAEGLGSPRPWFADLPIFCASIFLNEMVAGLCWVEQGWDSSAVVRLGLVCSLPAGHRGPRMSSRVSIREPHCWKPHRWTTFTDGHHPRLRWHGPLVTEGGPESTSQIPSAVSTQGDKSWQRERDCYIVRILRTGSTQLVMLKWSPDETWMNLMFI